MKSNPLTVICLFLLGVGAATLHYHGIGLLKERNSNQEQLGPRDDSRFSQLTDKELKARVNEYVRRLQDFRQRREAAINMKVDSRSGAISEVLDAYDAEFQSKFAGEGKALCGELLSRIPDSQKPKGFAESALAFGLLAGADPVGDAIAYLNTLSSLLVQ